MVVSADKGEKTKEAKKNPLVNEEKIKNAKKEENSESNKKGKKEPVLVPTDNSVPGQKTNEKGKKKRAKLKKNLKIKTNKNKVKKLKLM